MNAARFIADWESSFWESLSLLVLLTGAGTWAGSIDGRTTTTTIWDTLFPLGNSFNVENRENWRPVPRNLLALEADPKAAASDHGYYGRDDAFQGDPVVENDLQTQGS
jgi:hypothetical protein